MHHDPSLIQHSNECDLPHLPAADFSRHQGMCTIWYFQDFVWEQAVFLATKECAPFGIFKILFGNKQSFTLLPHSLADGQTQQLFFCLFVFHAVY